MRYPVQEILLVSSLYDSFLLAQDGQLHEQMTSEFMELNLSRVPGLTRVSKASEAAGLARDDPRINLIITTMNIGDMHVLDFAHKVREDRPEMPVVLLAFDNRDLLELLKLTDTSGLDKVFIWQGDFRILLAIVKYTEDRWNVEHDTKEMGVQSIILIEDNIRFYSSYLPMIYTELMKHSQSLISESVNLYHKLLRMRARPKILLCNTFEEAQNYFHAYEDHILGVISDVEFPRGGAKDPEAGAEFARLVKEHRPDIPILLQSYQQKNAKLAESLNASFLLKDSPTLLSDLRQFMINHFGFGDFIFSLPDGTEIDRASDMRTLEKKLHTIPDESLRYHGERDHFSNWLKARTEFLLADRLKPRKVSDYPSLAVLRQNLIESLSSFRRERSRGHVADFNRETFDETSNFTRIGGGSLGGKARGLAFMNRMLNTYPLGEEYEDVHISVPPTVVVCTDVFDEFLDRNHLRDFVLRSDSEADILKRFLKSDFSEDIEQDLTLLLDMVRYPLAIRSSSLMEDSQYHPFAGIYTTYMLPNNHPDLKVRLKQLLTAIKRVYASTFSHRAKHYMKATQHRLEEEKMAVIIQKLVGAQHEHRFYPDFAGVARSHNFYPSKPATSSDGVVSVALGFGRTVVEGGSALRFCPKYPRHLIQFSTTSDFLDYTQKTFFTLELDSSKKKKELSWGVDLLQCELDVAEQDGTLAPVASVYSAENDAVYDGLSRAGVRIVSFAPILKHKLFPLPEILHRVLEIGLTGMSCPVEIEFAVRLTAAGNLPPEFGVVQIRPLLISRELEEIEIEDIKPANLICQSSHTLGFGRIDNIRDIVMVDIDRFNRSESHKVADEVGWMNAKLEDKDIPYVLIGVGRWGSADPWLGIPVSWDQISGAKVIIEAGFKDLKVIPSQGTHFFQNLTALMIGYFTVNPDTGEGMLDWKWLAKQKAVEEKKYVRHLRFKEPIVIKMNGHTNQGVIFKPGIS
ncbi:PEP/pyruvate-binding domain-containing protein [bacterium]|nr:PEP/pyruvate-binding domain-containing protein [bacterium]